MSYKFWCSKCKFDHAGECAVKISITVDNQAPKKARSFIDEIQDLVKALEAGNYNAAPTKLHQCKQNPRDCDVCYPPGTFLYDDIRVKGDSISLSYRYKMRTPLTFIPITFMV
jgi:hypothetical protein